MSKVNRRQNRITAVFVLLSVIALLLNIYNEDINARIGLQSGWLQTAIYVILLTGWMHSVRTRLIQKGIRRHLIAMAGYLTLWIILRTLKYYAVAQYTDVSRWLWYLYYIPMMFYPVAALMAIRFIGENDRFTLPKRLHIVYGISAILSAFVLTNDLHELVFNFPDNGMIHTDFDYSRGFLFYVIFAWFLGCTFMIFYRMLCKCRLPGAKKRIVYPLIPLSIGLIYNAFYLTGHAKLTPDLTVTMSFLTVVAFELSIRAGLIRSNSNYPDLLKASSLPTQIMDQKGTVVYASDTAPVLDAAVLSEAMQEGSVIENGERISVYPIKHGCAVWNEDISRLLKVNEELEDVASELEEQYSVSQEVYQTTRRRQMLVEKNRLYNIMQNDTADKVQALSKLTDRIERSPDEKEIRRLTGEAAVLVAYIKRRNNLLFIHEGNDLIDSSDLIYCIRESLKSMELLGITTNVVLTLSSPMTFENATRLYDLFEAAIETAMHSASELFVTLQENSHTISLRMNLVCIEPLNALTNIGFRASNEEENEWVLRYDMENGGERV